MEDNTALNQGEAHLMANNAMEYIKTVPLPGLLSIHKSLANNALHRDRTAQICLGTLRQVLQRESVSDLDILGLAWFIKDWTQETVQ